VYKKILVGDHIEYGRGLLNALSELDPVFPITEAFWYEFPDLLEWRLVIASSIIDHLGPIHAYTVVRNLIERDRIPLSINDILLLSPNSADFQELRRVALGPGRMRTGPATGPAKDLRFSDAYLYKPTTPMRIDHQK
jgi:hypothetical protein